MSYKKPRRVNNNGEVITDMNDDYPSLSDMPNGLGMALMQNKRAMDYYTSLPDAAKQQVIDRTHTIESKQEMQAYVDSLGY